METKVHKGVICECVPSNLSIQSFVTWTQNGARNLIKEDIKLELHTPITFECSTEGNRSLVCTKCSRNMFPIHRLKCELLDREECERRLRGAILLSIKLPGSTRPTNEQNAGKEFHTILSRRSEVSAICIMEISTDSCVQYSKHDSEVDVGPEGADASMKENLQSKFLGEEKFLKIRNQLQSELQPQKQPLVLLTQTPIIQGENFGDDSKAR